MDSTQKDRAYLEAGIPELADYLLSNEIYWPISARGYSLPRLTIGGLLLAQARLEATGQRIEAVVAKLDGIRLKWRTAWETKADREVQARLGLWQNYLSDYRHSPYQHADAYPYEVRYRVMLHLLMEDIAPAPAVQDVVEQLDTVLRASLLLGNFIWDAALEGGFPRETYWFLYGTLKS